MAASINKLQTKFYFLLLSWIGLDVIYILLSEQNVTFYENIQPTKPLYIVPGTCKYAHICILTSKRQVYLQWDLWRGTARSQSFLTYPNSQPFMVTDSSLQCPQESPNRNLSHTNSIQPWDFYLSKTFFKFLSLLRAFWNLYSSLTNKCTIY